MKKKVLTRLALFCCLIVGLSVFSATQVQAHRIWRKYTKLPNGTYTIEKAYYEQKYWQQDGVTLKLGKYFVLNSSVQKKGSGRIYTSDPLKLKLSSKCKFYGNDIEHKKLKEYYPEFFDHICEYDDCRHVIESEKVCNVKSAVKSGKIDKGRYERYVYIYNKLKENYDRRYK